eukprot:SAG31_NODE_484_length_15037_cov_9.974762_2_plen_41_part_00
MRKRVVLVRSCDQLRDASVNAAGAALLDRVQLRHSYAAMP